MHLTCNLILILMLARNIKDTLDGSVISSDAQNYCLFLGKLMPFISSGKLDELLMQPRIYQNAQKHKKREISFWKNYTFPRKSMDLYERAIVI